MSFLSANEALLLGTAMWGWTVTREQAFALLDAYYHLGGRQVDTATNYPINKNPADFRKAEQWLQEWLRAHAIQDMKVMIKMGSVNNLKTPDHLLHPSFLRICHDQYREAFGANLHTLMIHWDNRAEREAIHASLATLHQLRQHDLTIGLSGIRYPEIYAPLLADFGWGRIPLQLKHNLLYSDWSRYQALHAYVNPIAYGINVGGIKLKNDQGASSLTARGGSMNKHEALVSAMREVCASSSHLATPPTKMNDLAMIYAFYHPVLQKVLLGTSKVEQLQDSFAWYEQISKGTYQSIYESLTTIAQDYVS